MGVCMSTQGSREEKNVELTLDLVNVIAAIVNNPKFQTLRKKSTYQRLYHVILKFSIKAIQNNQQMLDIMNNLNRNPNFTASLEILQFREWSDMMQQLKTQNDTRTNTMYAAAAGDEDDVVISNIDDMKSVDQILHHWLKTRCNFDEGECLRYVDIFKSNGLDSIDTVKEIKDSHLKEIGIQIRNRNQILWNRTHLIYALIQQSKQ
eukprot:UN02305